MQSSSSPPSDNVLPQRQALTGAEIYKDDNDQVVPGMGSCAAPHGLHRLEASEEKLDTAPQQQGSSVSRSRIASGFRKSRMCLNSGRISARPAILGLHVASPSVPLALTPQAVSSASSESESGKPVRRFKRRSFFTDSMPRPKSPLVTPKNICEANDAAFQGVVPTPPPHCGAISGGTSSLSRPAFQFATHFNCGNSQPDASCCAITSFTSSFESGRSETCDLTMTVPEMPPERSSSMSNFKSLSDFVSESGSRMPLGLGHGARVERQKRLKDPDSFSDSSNSSVMSIESLLQNDTMTYSQQTHVRKIQRNSSNLYDSKYFFPSSTRKESENLSDEDRLERTSLKRARQYMCTGTYGCKSVACLEQLQESDVLKKRQEYMRRRVSKGGQEVSMLNLLVHDIRSAYDRTNERWNKMQVHLDTVSSAEICVASFGLLVGVASSLLGRAMRCVKEGEFMQDDAGAPRTRSAQNEQRSLDFSLLRAYVADLLDKHEANPAPGAHQPGRMTHINKSTWKQKWESCQKHFADAHKTPGSISMLKRAWKLEKKLKEKKACSHSKCNICSKIDTGLANLVGVNTPAAKEERQHLFRARTEHEEQHLSQRMELDQAGLKAMTDPHYMWTILADAATQRNFLLPKFKHRTPKQLANKPLWSYKLMGTYAYGFGFCPFLVHDSQNNGSKPDMDSNLEDFVCDARSLWILA
jgi:hypothetical protein